MVVDKHPSTHPPLPPTTEDERLSWLRLLRSRKVGIAGFYRLLAQHGSARAALEVLPQMAREAGIKDYAPCPLSVAEQELARGERAGARLIFAGSPAYPLQFLDLPDPPPCFWILGQAEALERPLIAIVGSRNASSLGLRMARALAEDLGDAGFVTVSGLARGIDTAVHQASLSHGTIAVQAGGIDTIYPAENRDLAHRITDRGLRLSEQPPGFSPAARHFPMRNRLISGLARAVIVVEAAARSGSLITARNALDQGRDIMAVPGHPFDPRTAGCNMLLRDGATLVRHAADVIEALGPVEKTRAVKAPLRPDIPAPAPPRRSLRAAAALHGEILDRLAPAPLSEDDLIRDISATAEDVTPVLTDLELQGRIERHPGGLISIIT